jgi:3-oxoacyl-(acyl-carrier-protein) synthase
MRVLGIGLRTGWGAGVAALPEDARRAAVRREIVSLAPPALDGERFRRATRECRMGVAAVAAALADAGLAPSDVAGARTALVYVTAAAYGASNRAFVLATSGQAGGQAGNRRDTGPIYFPYTAPSAVPAEVAIEYGLTGGYVILVGGPAATVDALWQAGTLLAAGRCDRALVLAVETFEECGELWRRGRWTTPRPLVEAAACAVLAAGSIESAYGADDVDPAWEAAAARRAGQTLACGPLVALALARAEGAGPVRVTGTWRGRRAGVTVDVGTQAVVA